MVKSIPLITSVKSVPFDIVSVYWRNEAEEFMKKIVYILIFLISPLSLQAQDYKIILFGDSLMAGYG